MDQTNRQLPAIETKGLTIGYHLKKKQQRVVHADLNLSLRFGEVTCLLGLNGAGKSTLLRTLCGFQSALQGDIQLLGKDLSDYTRAEFAVSVGVVLTEKTNAGGITVYELVSLGRHPYTGFLGRLGQVDREIIEASMKAVGIHHKARNYVSELSDGERQKAMIAKVLAQQCPIILLDEPTAFLDVTSRIETMALLHQLATEQHKAILLSTHDLDLAIQMGDALWLLSKEQPVACGMPEDLILQGAFSSFFERGEITFDIRTGKLSRTVPKRKIGVQGDPVTAYWLGNALARKGYQAVEAEAGLDVITCLSATQFRLFRLGKEEEFTTIYSLMQVLN